MTQFEIKNKLFLHPSKLNNILDINLDKISRRYRKYRKYRYRRYRKYTIIEGYFETNGDGVNYLTIIFDNEKYEKIFKSIWNKIKENNFDEYAKNCNVISFKSDDILKYGCPININTITIIIRSVFRDDCCYYPQIYFDNCSYNYKDE